MSNHNTYATISTVDLSLIDFSQIGETSKDTIRKNIAETEFIIKYLIEPTFIIDGSVVPLSEMNHAEALILMGTAAWSEPIPVD